MQCKSWNNLKKEFVMKAKMRTWFNLWMTALLGLIGFGCTGCLKKYGCPYSEFSLDGQVTNEEKEVLPDIQIVNIPGYQDNAGNMSWYNFPDTTYTDGGGRYSREYSEPWGSHTFHKVIAHDPSGTYQSDSVIKTVTYTGGDGEWDFGKAELHVNFVLKKK